MDRGKESVRGVAVSVIDYESAVAHVIDVARVKRGMTVTALAVHGVMTGLKDPVHRYRINSFDLVVPGLQPVRWALNWLHGAGLPTRPSVRPHLDPEGVRDSRRSGPGRVPLRQHRPEVLRELRKNVLKSCPKLIIAGAQPPRFRQIFADEKEQIAREIRDSGAAISFVGLGCPRQEIWAHEYREALRMPVWPLAQHSTSTQEPLRGHRGGYRS